MNNRPTRRKSKTSSRAADDSLIGIRFAGKKVRDTLNYIEELYRQSLGMGYQWGERVFLPEGTTLRITHQQKDYYALAGRKGIWHEGTLYSPESLATRIAGPSCDPWRAFWVKKPESAEWDLAYDLHHGGAVRRMPSRKRR